MPLDEAELHRASERIRHAEKVLLVSHIRPDGDAIGSILGMGLALEASGRTIQMVNADGVPPSLRHLEGSDRICHRPEGIFDLIIALDCSDLDRTGNVLNEGLIPNINIDHHLTNLKYAEINLVDIDAAASCEMIADFLPKFGLKLSRTVAAALLSGMISDTLGFRTPNVRPKTLELASCLLETGVDMADLYRRALTSHTFEAIKFWGTGLVKLEREGRLVWTSLTMADRKDVNYPGRDDADLINILSSIENADVAVIFVEQPNGKIKVSWRAQPGCDVSRLAVEYGGGGHSAASGAEFSGSLVEVMSIVLEKTRLLVNGGPYVQ